MLNPGSELPIGGLTPLTTVDWPDRLAAVIYTRGCPWRCPYCHNRDMQRVEGEGYDWARVLSFLNLRRGLLDGVVFSGGEPCLHTGLAEAMAEVRALGFGTALHTGGAFPTRLGEILARGLVDWVGFDLKAPLEDPEAYTRITGRQDAAARVRQSLLHLVDSGVAYELRTTVYEPVLDSARLTRLAGEVRDLGGANLVLQACLADPTARPSEAPGLSRLADRLTPLVGPVQVRI